MGLKHLATSALVALNIFSIAHARTPAISIPDFAIDGNDYSHLAELAAKMSSSGAQEPVPGPGPGPYEFQTGELSANRKEKRAGGTRVLIAGDSMTQGKEGDWTWRYRIWQWAQANGLGWDFVG